MIKKLIITIAVLSLTSSCKTLVDGQKFSAYEAVDYKGRLATYCGCNHKGYFIITNDKILWFVTEHDEVQEKGAIIEKVGNVIKSKESSSVIEYKKLSEIKKEGDFIFVSEYSEFRDSKYKLKKVELSYDIKEKINKYLKNHNNTNPERQRTAAP
jgi:hypothetical protein